MTLQERLNLHKKWLNNEADGVRFEEHEANLTGANLTGADLTRANLTRADLTMADLTRADLSMVNLTGANLTRADLTRADLSMVNLTGANLTRADLTGANLSMVNLTGADLSMVNMYDANLYKAKNVARIYVGQHELVATNTHIKIGCKHGDYAYWADNYKSIGLEAKYTEQEIELAWAAIQLIKKWQDGLVKND